ncbi:hypothetical protein [Sphingopyxis sp. MG]|uniref:hypothetical protein n=1 Tax=Sphingopyxis sp. MG TaxID=1866325 RepID=UPI000CDF50F5|nr:hypothetical protein [Sphingopyxis sp. MG]AVA13648.1 hypothetical protein C3E99_07170 [Sphingopyxis sp. MG]
MLKERLEIAQKLAKEVHDVENAIDNAILKIGVLTSSMPEAQAAAKLSAVASDGAFAHLQGAIAAMLSGRSSVVALHNELASIKDKVGLKNIVVGYGDAGKLLPAKARANRDMASAKAA